MKIEDIEFKKDHLYIIDNKLVGWRYLCLCQNTNDLEFKILKMLKRGKFYHNPSLYNPTKYFYYSKQFMICIIGHKDLYIEYFL